MKWKTPQASLILVEKLETKVILSVLTVNNQINHSPVFVEEQLFNKTKYIVGRRHLWLYRLVTELFPLDGPSGNGCAYMPGFKPLNLVKQKLKLINKNSSATKSNATNIL